MKCAECEKAGLKSIVNVPNGSFSTCMMEHRFYDEDGRYHFHDPNRRTSEWSCSNGHRWVDVRWSRCPAQGCDWNAENERREAVRRALGTADATVRG